MAVAKPKLNEYAEMRRAIIEDFCVTHTLDRVACKRLEKTLIELLELAEFSDQARVQLGLLKALVGNFEESRRHFDRAEQLSANDSWMRCWRATAAVYDGHMVEAWRLLESIELIDDPGFLKMFISQSMQAGTYIKAAEAVNRMKKLNSSFINQDCAVALNDVCVGAEFLVRKNVTDKDVVERLQVAADVVRRELPRHPFVMYGFNASSESGLHYSFPLHLPEDKLVELDWAISEALVEHFEDALPEIVSFSVTPPTEMVLSFR